LKKFVAQNLTKFEHEHRFLVVLIRLIYDLMLSVFKVYKHHVVVLKPH